MTEPHELLGSTDDVVIDLPTTPSRGDNAATSNNDNVVLLLPGVQTAGRPDQPLSVRLHEALDASKEMILVVEPSGHVLFANTAAKDTMGFGADTKPTSSFRAIESLLSGPRRSEVWEALEQQDSWQGDLSTTRSDGSTVHLELTLLADRTDTGDVQSLTIVAHDVGEHRALQHALQHRSTHDGLTGLANRQHLLSELNALLPDLQERSVGGALLLVDIDEFRTVTNSLGHEAGDRVLVAFAYRLLRTFAANTLLARVGGDEFGVFCPGVIDLAVLEDLMTRTTEAPFYIDGSEVHLSVVTGVALTTPDAPALNAESMLRDADAASHRGKERGRGSFEAFQPQLQADAADRMAVVQDLRRALRAGELRALYQPKIDLRTGQIVGAEALMRWQPPSGPLRTPDSFIEIAEDTGLILPMGRWMLREVANEISRLQKAGHRLEISLNLSARQLDQHTFPAEVADVLRETGMDPQLIEFEITESALMHDVETSAHLLSQLKALGVGIAVDDFGTGYSSLQYLQRLPVDVLKVDRAFVSSLETSSGDRAIVEAVIQLAQALKLRSVAEGVETAEQQALVTELGCDLAQGYYIARPMPIEDFEAMAMRTIAPA